VLRLRKGSWIAPAAALATLAALVVIVVWPAFDHRPLEAGVFYALLRFDNSLPLAGFGLALAQETRRQIALSLALAVAAIGLGAVLAQPLARAIEADFRAMHYLFLVGPAYCMATGLALLAPARLRPFALALVAVFSGAVLGLVVPLNQPTLAEVEFAAGAVATGIGLALVPLLLLLGLEWPGLRIVMRILGSWLVAIGIMLAGLELARIKGTADGSMPALLPSAYIGLI
jgi:hypothetical protein